MTGALIVAICIGGAILLILTIILAQAYVRLFYREVGK